MRRSGFVVVLAVVACARTGLLDFDHPDGDDDGTGGTGGTSAPECATTADCPVTDRCAPPTCRPDGPGADATLRCLPTPVACDDADACSVDRCDPATGACVYERAVDTDRDGSFGPAPDGVPEACGGDDCDDDDPMVHPGGAELCNGRDDDCDGAVDEGTEYTTLELLPRPLAPPERDRATRGGLVWNGETYAVTYNTTSSHKQSFFKLLDASGLDASPEVEVSHINADAYAGPVEWSGESFFTAFSDARQDGNYEVYAARFRSDGLKIQGGDIRLTNAPDFSLNPAIVWTGDAYVVAWDDRRSRASGGFPQIFARRFSEHGEPLGDEVLASPQGEWGEYPALAVGEHSLGLAYVSLASDGVPIARFRTLDLTLAGSAAPVELPLSRFANSPSIAYAEGRYVVAWSFVLDSSLPGAAVHAAAVDETTSAVSGGHPVTFGFSFARAPSLVSLGDRVFLAFSGAGADGAYDIWASVVPASLETPSAALRLTTGPALSLFPYAARGPDGTIAVVYDEDVQTPPTSRQPYFLAVSCRAPIP